MADKQEKEKTGKGELDERLKDFIEGLGKLSSGKGTKENLFGGIGKKGLGWLDELDEILMAVDVAMAAGEEVAKKVKPRIVKAIKILLESGLDIRKDLGPELERLSIIKAKSRFSYYKNLIKAGFNKNAAFKLLLAEIKPISFNEQLGNAVKTAALVSKK